jgi:hypothetical protein
MGAVYAETSRFTNCFASQKAFLNAFKMISNILEHFDKPSPLKAFLNPRQVVGDVSQVNLGADLSSLVFASWL